MPVRSRYSKRLFDLVVASLALLVLSPLIAAVALMIRLKLGSPILFIQTRPGLHGRPFRLVKFRTMLHGDASGTSSPNDESRLTPFGRFLRSASLDELPELWNVVRGEMSLVGPRPLLLHYLEHYSPFQMRRHEVRPGITGWSQVNGRNAVTWDERFSQDVWYVENQSFLLDLRILLMTLGRVFVRSGISAEGAATMPQFVSVSDETKREQSE